MPIYEYRCPHCNASFERFERVDAKSDDATCPRCQRDGATRVPSRFASGPASCGPASSGGTGFT